MMIHYTSYFLFFLLSLLAGAWPLASAPARAADSPVEITDEGIARLPDRVVTQIVQDLNEQYKPASAEKNEQ